jgi:phage terminase large subunit-like protein
LTNSRPAAPLGSQEPRLSSAPKSVSSSGDDAIELAHIAGLDLDPWQQHVLRVALGEKPDGRWSAFEVGLIVPRQNGKGSILEARELAGLFLFGERLILHSAHEMKTAVEAYLRIKYLIESTPELNEQVEHFYQSNEKTAIELKNGSRLRFMARSSGSGRGFTGDVIILDEAYNLPFETLAAVLPTMSAKSITGNPQLWYTSSAGLETSDVLATVRARGVKGDKGLAFFDWSAPDDADPDDREAWAMANPGLGIRIGEDFVEKERAAFGEDEAGLKMFLRERLGVWHDPNRGTVIDPQLWASLALEATEVERPELVAFSVDVPPDRSTASIGIAGARSDGSLHVQLDQESVGYRGTAWVAERVAELVAKWSPCAVVLDASGPAGSLVAPLREAGVEVVTTSAREMGAACGMFYDAATDSRLRHLNDNRLNASLAAARKRPLGDAWAWHRKGVSDISPLVAVTLAVWGFTTRSQREPKTKAPSKAFAF